MPWFGWLLIAPPMSGNKDNRMTTTATQRKDSCIASAATKTAMRCRYHGAGNASGGGGTVFCFCFCSSALWGHVVPSLLAADIGMMANSVATVVFVGAVVPQAETKTAGQRQQQREDACVASAGITTATQRQSGIALMVRTTLALSHNVLVPALQQ